jgi:putative DNA primase/helicase
MRPSAKPAPNGADAHPVLSQAEADAEIERLAALPAFDYAREEKAAADRLDLSVTWLRQFVKRRQAEILSEAAGGTLSDTSGQGRALNPPNPEPWPDAINGAALLSGIVQEIERYMVMEPGAAETVALWVIHTHALDAFGISPRLSITSPRPGCGKTTLLDVLQRLVLKPLLAANVSPPAVFRSVEFARPTLLIDEADTFLKDNQELRGVLNSGHRRGGNVVRIVGDNMEPREFSTFSPAAIAMIGKLPGTLADRSVAITLKRKRPDELVEHFRFERTEPLDRLARMCARWAADNMGPLKKADPEVPPNLFNRTADNWRPLLAIADLAGGEWPERARTIAAAAVDSDQQKRVGLLSDIRDVFDAKDGDRIKSADLVAALAAMEGHPWAEFGKSGKPLSPNALAYMLADDHIKPKPIRFGPGPKDTAKGYERGQFEDAFARYLPQLPYATVTPSQPAEILGFSQEIHPSQANGCDGSEISGNASFPATCDGVTDEKPGSPPNHARTRVVL